MERVKYIKRIGDSAGVIFNREEREIYDIGIGDMVEVMIKKNKKDNNPGDIK